MHWHRNSGTVTRHTFGTREFAIAFFHREKVPKGMMAAAKREQHAPGTQPEKPLLASLRPRKPQPSSGARAPPSPTGEG